QLVGERSVLTRVAIHGGRQSGQLRRTGRRVLDARECLLGFRVLPMAEAGPDAIHQPADRGPAVLRHLSPVFSPPLRTKAATGPPRAPPRRGGPRPPAPSMDPRPPDGPRWRHHSWPVADGLWAVAEVGGHGASALECGGRELAERLRARRPKGFLCGWASR